ncbi:SDR family oxidoreductase [Pseudomonas koreensis]|uniref:SDR family oxidoreductase n=1 Tax=Pseudomonas koreensis TaxID=198620 RepID=UPI003015BFD2
MNDFDKVALVTGANRGIGFEVARQLAAEGVTVVLSGRNYQAVAQAADELVGMGLKAFPCLMDVTDEDSIASAVKLLEAKFGRLDILINNAAIRIESYGLNPSQQPLQQWRQTFETNLFGMVAVTQHCLPLIRQSVAGRIVNVSSLLASLTTHTDVDSYAYSSMFKSLPGYSASKSGVNSWTVHLAYELRDTPVKVNAVHPGYTKTGMNDGAGDLDVQEGARTSVALALIGADGPTGTYRHQDRVIPW